MKLDDDPKLDDALTRLRAAVDGAPAPFAEQLAAARARSGVPDEELPRYLPRALAALAAGTSDGEEVAPVDRGGAWLLADFVELIPGATLIDELDRDGLAVPALGRALIITRNDERWSVAPWPPAAKPSGPRSLDTFNPTPEQIRAWARDADLRFTTQDEDLAVLHPASLALLVELAADPAGAKRGYIRSILDRIVGQFGPARPALIERARDLARATGDAALADWAAQLDRTLAYAGGHGPVTLDEARTIARDLLLGQWRPALPLHESSSGDWWTFQAGTFDSLLVHRATGNLAWARRPLTAAELAVAAAAPTRLAPIAGESA